MYDVIGIGIGPFNLGLAALTEEMKDVKSLFFDQKPYFEWHGGLLIDETTLQVPFLADAVTMADPKSRFSFLNYLYEHNRLYKFYFLERFHIPRREYNHYCQWISKQVTNCCFGKRVTAVQWSADFSEVSWFEGELADDNGYFKIETTDIETGMVNYYYSRHLVIGVGSVPYIPDSMSHQSGEGMFHSAQFLQNRERLRKADSITVVGSGQSAAEVFLELVKEQHLYGYQLDWFTRSKGFFPMEYSKLGLEHFSPDYTKYFYQLPQEKKDEQLPKQDLLYKGISAATIADIYDVLYEYSVGGAHPPVRLLAKTEVVNVTETEQGTYQLVCNQWEQEQTFSHESEIVIAATGYQHPIPGFVSNLKQLIAWDEKGRYIVEENYQLKLTKEIANQVFIQNGEMHTHGVGAPDLGLGAYRNSMIINQLCNKEVYPVRNRHVFQQFGV